MNYNEFISTYKGKTFDYDSVSGVQCVDLAKMYMNKVFGLTPLSLGNAKDYYENYNNAPILYNNFTRIANTPNFVPQKGDLVVWGTGLGKYGHIAIATGVGNKSNFKSWDLNWGSKYVTEILHSYKGFLGVLRPKDQTKINGKSYSIGRYKVIANPILNVRTGCGTSNRAKIYSELTENARLQNKNLGNSKANGYLKGVICSVTKVIDNWGLTASGWICLDYCEKM